MIRVFDLKDVVRFPSGMPRPAPPPPTEPLSAQEEVFRACNPVRELVDKAWDGYVESTRRANGRKDLAEALIKTAVKEADVARQYLTLARLKGTAPCGPVEDVTTN